MLISSNFAFKIIWSIFVFGPQIHQAASVLRVSWMTTSESPSRIIEERPSFLAKTTALLGQSFNICYDDWVECITQPLNRLPRFSPNIFTLYSKLPASGQLIANFFIHTNCKPNGSLENVRIDTSFLPMAHLVASSLYQTITRCGSHVWERLRAWLTRSI